MELTREEIQPKFKKGDGAYYLDNGKINPVTINQVDRVFNGDGEHIDWVCKISGHRAMAYMDGVYAPIGLCLSQKKLYKTKEELIDFIVGL